MTTNEGETGTKPAPVIDTTTREAYDKSQEWYVYLVSSRPKAIIQGREAAVVKLIQNAPLTGFEKGRIKTFLEMEKVEIGHEIRVVGWWGTTASVPHSRIESDRLLVRVNKE